MTASSASSGSSAYFGTPVRHVAGPVRHRAARFEDAVQQLFERRFRQRGWRPIVVPYAGYGAPGWARVLGRVLLSRPNPEPTGRVQTSVRGWRSFTTFSVKDSPATIEAGGRRHDVYADRGGFVDAVVEVDLPPGWGTVRISSPDAEPVDAPVYVVDPAIRVGIISDIDDTVMVTALPRPLLAAWNTFVLDEHARTPVPGMAVLYERLANAYPGAPVMYLSTGAWNVAPTLTRFLSRQLYPSGPLLLTDWGPTIDRWFRNGPEHKRSTLERLAREFPDIRWLLIGDDGQHDQELYAEFAAAYPENVAAVAIRHLSPAESVLAGGLPAPPDGTRRSAAAAGVRWFSAPNGAGLSRLLRGAGLL